MKLVTLLVTLTALSTTAMQAQFPAAHVEEAKTRYLSIRDNIQKAAEAMPEADYSFKPTPDIRSFGELMAHIADAQANICGAAVGATRPVNAAKMTVKADLVAALKASSEACTAGFDSTTEANATTAAAMGQRMKSTRIGLLEYNLMHDAEEYGYAAVYLRLKGVVPPTSAPRK
jgi:uncharacterized damage-inducible protein DinB